MRIQAHSKEVSTKTYRPSFLDTTGDLRPSVERELVSISNAIKEESDKFKNFRPHVDDQGHYIYPTGGGGGNVPIATTTTPGIVKIGAGISVTSDGTISAAGGGSSGITEGQATVSPTGAWTFTQPVTSAAPTADSHLITRKYADDHFETQTAVTTALALKADKTAVATSLDLKADKTDVTTSLALKADKTDVDTALGLKANTSDVYSKTDADAKFALKGSGGSFDPTADQSITGTWSFTKVVSGINSATPADTELATVKYVKDHAGSGGGSFDPSANQTITGDWTFSKPTWGYNGTAPDEKELTTVKYVTDKLAAINPVSMEVDSFIGAVQWFNGKRPKIPSSYIPADGQILNRADEPELWAKVADGTFQSVSDALWLDDGSDTTVTGTKAGQRAKYSWGDGTLTTGTTFRVPDINGGQVGTVANAFLRGYGTDGDQETIGRMALDGAPNITGTFASDMNARAWFPFKDTNAAGAFSTKDPQTNSFRPINVKINNVDYPTFDNVTENGTVVFDASKSYSSYGRSPNEIRPRAAVGLWIIKTKSGIIKGVNVGTSDFTVRATRAIMDASLRAKGAEIYGATPFVDFHFGQMDPKDTTSTIDYNVRLVNDSDGILSVRSANGDYGKTLAGDISAFGRNTTADKKPGVIRWYGALPEPKVNPSDPDVYPQFNISFNGTTPEVIVNRSGTCTTLNWNNTILTGVQSITSSTGQSVQWTGSDISLKKDLKLARPDSLSSIMMMVPKEFTWKNDGRRARGLIAQELQAVDPIYTYTMPGFDVLNVDMYALITDLVGAVKQLKGMIDSKDQQIIDLQNKYSALTISRKL